MRQLYKKELSKLKRKITSESKSDDIEMTIEEDSYMEDDF
jgi:hypothetical protein